MPLLVDHSSVSKLHQTSSEQSQSEEEMQGPRLPGLAPSLSRKGRNIIGNVFARVDRSGKIVKTKRDIEKERKGLVQLDSESLTFDDDLSIAHRNLKAAISNVQAEEGESKAARKSGFPQ